MMESAEMPRSPAHAGEMLPLLKRHEIQVLLRAGHSQSDVAARTSVSTYTRNAADDTLGIPARPRRCSRNRRQLWHGPRGSAASRQVATRPRTGVDDAPRRWAPVSRTPPLCESGRMKMVRAARITGLVVLGVFTVVGCKPALSPAASASDPSALTASLCMACSLAASADPTGLTASLCAACDNNSDASDGSDSSSSQSGATASAKPRRRVNRTRTHASRSRRRRGGDEPGAAEDSDATVDSARLATFAYELVEYGRKAPSAAALRGAAELVGTLGVEKLEVTKETEAAAAPPPAAAVTKPFRDLPTRDALLAEAAAIDGAAKAPAMAAAAATRGAKGGPKSHLDMALGYSTDKFRVVFRGNSPAFVSVVGDGDTDLDCFVTDEDGNLIASDTNPTDRCSMAWTPVWTGPFTIRVKNLGDSPNLYHLTTN